jgi:hypothetical protein
VRAKGGTASYIGQALRSTASRSQKCRNGGGPFLDCNLRFGDNRHMEGEGGWGENLRGAMGVKNGVKSGPFRQPLSQDVALFRKIRNVSVNASLQKCSTLDNPFSYRMQTIATCTMETAELLSLVGHLEDNIDDLEENLEPLLAAALSATTKKLPVLDRAKLYVLIVYSIESLLFC